MQVRVQCEAVDCGALLQVLLQTFCKQCTLLENQLKHAEIGLVELKSRRESPAFGWATRLCVDTCPPAIWPLLCRAILQPEACGARRLGLGLLGAAWSEPAALASHRLANGVSTIE